MSIETRESVHAGRLAGRLLAARRDRFVGREAELALFRSALQENCPFAVLHIHGPGGVGKTALLRSYAQLAADAGRFVIHLDGRTLEASPFGFLLALQQAVGIAPQDALPTLPELPPTSVLFIDTYETISGLDEWLRMSFLPQLPQRCLVVIAGRNAPAVAWYTDVEWAELARVLSLRNLRPEESQRFLATRGVPETQHAGLLAVTHGHPLALSLIADAFAQGNALDSLSLQKQPDIVRVLLERFVEEIPSATHRLALEISVMVWATTESLLAEVMGAEDAHTAFEWLRRLPFMEAGSQGLFPHDLAREVLHVDFRWRDAEGHRHLYKELIGILYQRLQQAHIIQQQRIWFDIFYVARHNPYMAPYFDWQALGGSYAEVASAADLPAILEMVEKNEGPGQAKLAAYWFQRQPRAYRVFRNGSEVIGFMAHLALHEATAEDIATDPALPAALAYVQRYGPVQPDEEIVHLRFWMGRDAHQGVSPAINLTAINATIYWTTHSKLAWNFVATFDPEYLRPHFTMIKINRSPEADFVVDGHRYGVFSHDWRVEPPYEWLQLKADRYGLSEVELESLEQPKRTPVQPILVLSEPEFVEATRRALRDYTRADLLAANPLLRSRLVVDKGANEPTKTLRSVLRQSVELLKNNPKDEKLYRALWHTYFEPAATQEQAAELLDLPFSTYRYHLTNGVERIVAWLWQAELDNKSQ
jgi:hypothetical protein